MMRKLHLIVLTVLLSVATVGCGKTSAKPAPEIIQKQNQPDLEAFKAEIAEEQRVKDEAAAAAEAELHRDWVPTGGYSCVSTNLTIYVRVESVDINAGTAEVYYQVSENGRENSSGITKSGATLKRTDNGNGNLEYEIRVSDDIQLFFKGYIRDRESTIIYKGSKLWMENHGNGK